MKDNPMPRSNIVKVNLSIPHFPISVNVHGGDIHVTYGAQTVTARDYDSAIKEIGAAVMHALACDGRLPADFVK
jgi:hypothetical protein